MKTHIRTLIRTVNIISVFKFVIRLVFKSKIAFKHFTVVAPIRLAHESLYSVCLYT